jgi:hypothetical protein
MRRDDISLLLPGWMRAKLFHQDLTLFKVRVSHHLANLARLECHVRLGLVPSLVTFFRCLNSAVV